jgi:Tfp pilus assembly protein FimT
MLLLGTLRRARLPIALVLVALALGFTAGAWSKVVEKESIRERTAHYIELEQSITLTDQQEAVRRAALEAIPAPCCSDNSAYTCCCPCNFSRTIWGLSKDLIANQGLDAVAVRAEVESWIQEVNPGGFSGDVCYTAGGCNRAFDKNGCGGMSPTRVVF